MLLTLSGYWCDETESVSFVVQLNLGCVLFVCLTQILFSTVFIGFKRCLETAEIFYALLPSQQPAANSWCLGVICVHNAALDPALQRPGGPSLGRLLVPSCGPATRGCQKLFGSWAGLFLVTFVVFAPSPTISLFFPRKDSSFSRIQLIWFLQSSAL